MRIDLDFAHLLAEPAVTRDPNGAFLLSLAHRTERLVVHLSLPSLEALSFALSAALSEIKRC